jgi:hypothetical protein
LATIGRAPPYDRPPFSGHESSRRPCAPMRIAILTDIHANLPALEAVLAAVDEAGI